MWTSDGGFGRGWRPLAAYAQARGGRAGPAGMPLSDDFTRTGSACSGVHDPAPDESNGSDTRPAGCWWPARNSWRLAPLSHCGARLRSRDHGRLEGGAGAGCYCSTTARPMSARLDGRTVKTLPSPRICPGCGSRWRSQRPASRSPTKTDRHLALSDAGERAGSWSIFEWTYRATTTTRSADSGAEVGMYSAAADESAFAIFATGRSRSLIASAPAGRLILRGGRRGARRDVGERLLSQEVLWARSSAARSRAA